MFILTEKNKSKKEYFFFFFFGDFIEKNNELLHN